MLLVSFTKLFVYSKLFFHNDSILNSRRLWIAQKYKSYSKCTINSGMHQNSILIHLLFSTLIVSLTLFCVRLLYELMIMLSTYHVTNHLTCQNKLRYAMGCNLILKIWKWNTRNISILTSASNYLLIFGKLFNIYKLIHIYLKPRILIVSFSPLLNN